MTALTVETILVVDDDPHIRRVICYVLKSEYRTIEAKNGQQALDCFREGQVNLILLDIMMPETEIDGTHVCQEIRNRPSTVPIIFLTALEDAFNEARCIDLGGDDYITKPFDNHVLLARVKRALWRSNKHSNHEVSGKPESSVITCELLRLDPECHEVYFRDEKIELTEVQFEFLRTLMTHPKKVFSPDQIMDRAYKHDHHVVSKSTIHGHVRDIRREFRDIRKKYRINDKEYPIETIRGVGFKLKN